MSLNPDPVTRPAHYVVNGLECLEVIESLGLGYHLGNVLKYVWRAGRKTEDGVEDLRKALFYLDREITRRTRGENLDQFVNWLAEDPTRVAEFNK